MTNPSAGIGARYFAKIESTFDTPSAFVSGDAIPLLDMKFTPKQEYHRSMEHLGTASLVDEIKGKSGGTWSASAYLKPNAVGTAPDIGPLLKAAFGTETIDSGTSVTYSFNSSDPLTLQLGRGVDDKFGEWAFGAWVEECTIEIQGNQEPKITFSGGFATYAWAFECSCVTYNGGAVTVVPSTAYKSSIGVGAFVQVGYSNGYQTNSQAGYKVTGVNPSTRVVTVASSYGGSNGTYLVRPYFPPSTLSGTIIGGISAGLSLDGGSTAIGMISGKTVIKTGYKGLDNEATTSKVNRITRGRREINVEIQAYFIPADDATWIGSALDGLVSGYVAGDANLLMRAGENTAGARAKIIATNARVDVSSLDIPDAEAVTCTIKLVPRVDSADDDEMTFVLD